MLIESGYWTTERILSTWQEFAQTMIEQPVSFTIHRSYDSWMDATTEKRDVPDRVTDGVCTRDAPGDVIYQIYLPEGMLIEERFKSFLTELGYGFLWCYRESYSRRICTVGDEHWWVLANFRNDLKALARLLFWRRYQCESPRESNRWEVTDDELAQLPKNFDRGLILGEASRKPIEP